ncbi:MAG: DegV family protein, partial [Lachnospiraceae bacterium]|nr:DegV family protein [Lachnospiraceae bacterium]
ITVIDTLNVSLAETIMLIKANELKESGASYDEVISAIEEFKTHIHSLFTVNDLFHLQRGGRVSKTTAVIGSALNLKPSLSITA